MRLKLTQKKLKQLIQEEISEAGLAPRTKVQGAEVKILNLGAALEKAYDEAQIVSGQLGDSYLGTVVQEIMQELEHAIEKLQEN
tara:strand:- start:254 stop:505 length:252 start_codon:yes stop_codon:yes gene_type:complete